MMVLWLPECAAGRLVGWRCMAATCLALKRDERVLAGWLQLALLSAAVRWAGGWRLWWLSVPAWRVLPGTRPALCRHICLLHACIFVPACQQAIAWSIFKHSCPSACAGTAAAKRSTCSASWRVSPSHLTAAASSSLFQVCVWCCVARLVVRACFVWLAVCCGDTGPAEGLCGGPLVPCTPGPHPACFCLGLAGACDPGALCRAVLLSCIACARARPLLPCADTLYSSMLQFDRLQNQRRWRHSL